MRQLVLQNIQFLVLCLWQAVFYSDKCNDKEELCVHAWLAVHQDIAAHIAWTCCNQWKSLHKRCDACWQPRRLATWFMILSKACLYMPSSSSTSAMTVWLSNPCKKAQLTSPTAVSVCTAFVQRHTCRCVSEYNLDSQGLTITTQVHEQQKYTISHGHVLPVGPTRTVSLLVPLQQPERLLSGTALY